MTQLEEIIAMLAGVPEKDASVVVADALEATGHMAWIPNPGPQTTAYFSEADEIFYGGQAGGGKKLDSETLVPVPLRTSPTGYKKHGELARGDFVYGKSGEEVEVLACHPFDDTPESYELTFSTGEKIKACADHLWETWSKEERERVRCASPEWRAKRKATRPSRAKAESKKPGVSASITRLNVLREHVIVQGAPSVRTTQEIYETRYVEKTRVNHAIAVAKPAEGDDVVLPCDPYLFGLWLGDGYTHHSAIIMLESDWQEIGKHTPTPKSESDKDHEATRKQRILIRRFEELAFVRKLGKKHIPPVYLRASYHQRLELLRGMMDTDGTVDVRGKCELGFSNHQLALDALDVVNSLGIKAAIKTKLMKSEKHATHYRMSFVPEVPVFKLPRKASRQKAPTRGTTDFRYIEKVEPCAPVRMNCLTVAGGGVYCVGREFIVTHNTDLELGLSLTAHTRSLVLRRTNKEADGLVERLAEILGSRDGWNSQGGIWRRPNGVTIEIGGCQLEEDKQKRKGIPHDLICFDEVSDFTESQYTFIIGWNRSADGKQRCRIVAAGNPPTRPEGLWVIHRWAAWLDPQHPNPAQPGELRWYTNIKGKDTEVDGPGPHIVEGEAKPVYARSRTFIPAELADNPDLSATNYGAVLSALPEELRAAYRDGRFDLALRDDAFQAIPTAWVKAAQARWSPTPPVGVPMCAIGVDVAQGGTDKTVLALRYDGWYAPLIDIPGVETPDGATVAGLVVKHRRNDAEVIVDVGGGWGGDAYGHLRANHIPSFAYMGVKASTQRTVDQQLKFSNVRTEAYWRFREALDPSQAQGSGMALPPDATLLSDLCAPTYEVGSNGIKLESKEKVCDRIGRSTDKGDAVVMAWYKGLKQQNVQDGWRGLNARKPQVVMGHMGTRR